MSELSIISRFGEIRVVDEPTYTLRSTDNARTYAREIVLGDYAANFHGVLRDGSPRILVAAVGVATGIHANSAILRDNRLLLAAGNHVLCLSLPSAELQWATNVDFATCFGIHLSSDEQVLICHGELSLSRVDENGAIVWQRSGRDIFTGRLEMGPTSVIVHDFYDELYEFDLATGVVARGPRRTNSRL